MRQVIFLDLDAFFASVEVLLNPDLRDRPLVVAMGNPHGRGVVSTASYAARRFGVHSAMPLREALRLCPQVVVVPVRHEVYAEYSHRVMSLAREYSPLVEQVSIDEAYIEIPPEGERAAETMARELQGRIREEIGLDGTLAVATNKLVAKVACNTVKPRGFVLVPPGQEQAFLAPLPVDRLPGAGPVTRSRLERWQVRTLGDLAAVPVAELQAEFGKHGLYLSAAARGQDDSPVVADGRPKSLSLETTFEYDTRDRARLLRQLDELCAGLAEELGRAGYQARTIVLKLRYADFQTLTRQVTLPEATAGAAEVRNCVRLLFERHWEPRRAVRLLGVGAHNLVEPSEARQLAMNLQE